MLTVVIRRCRDTDWRDVRRLHLKMALAFPMVVDVDLDRVVATTDEQWQEFVHTCAHSIDQALVVAGATGARDAVDANGEIDRCIGMVHLAVEGPLARLSMLYVDDGERRHGVGAALVAGAVRFAHQAGATDLTGHIPDGSPAERLAAAMGFRPTTEVYVTRNRLTERRWIATVADITAAGAETP